LEATAYGVRHNIEVMQQAGARIDRVVAVGGGTTGTLWTQTVSDVTGLAQDIRRTTVGASYGAAHLAARVIADVDIDVWNPLVDVVEPDPAAAELHDERYGLYRELYPATRSLVHQLAPRTDGSMA
jgi:xylulokinase